MMHIRSSLILSLVVLAATLLTACGSDSTGGVVGAAPLRTLSVGETIPLGTTVEIVDSGTYPLETGASRLRTRCFGRVAVTIERVPGSPETNTCDSDNGSSNQTNDVTGVDSVVYDIDAGALARVTLN